MASVTVDARVHVSGNKYHMHACISGTSQCGKSTLAMHIAKQLIENDIIVFIADPTQVWFKFNAIKNTISVAPREKQRINWNDETTLFDVSRLNPFEQQKFIELFCANVMHVAINRVNRPKIIVVFEEAHTPIYNGSMRAKRSRETARLLTQGGNFNVRFMAITQFSAMCDKLLVKLAQQRFFGRTSEKNDKDYLHSFLGDKVEQLEDLKRGEFLYNYGRTTKRIRVGMFNKAAKQHSWLNYQHPSLGDYSKIG